MLALRGLFTSGLTCFFFLPNDSPFTYFNMQLKCQLFGTIVNVNLIREKDEVNAKQKQLTYRNLMQADLCRNAFRQEATLYCTKQTL